jgi:hypothetical protein
MSVFIHPVPPEFLIHVGADLSPACESICGGWKHSFDLSFIQKLGVCN